MNTPSTSKKNATTKDVGAETEKAKTATPPPDSVSKGVGATPTANAAGPTREELLARYRKKAAETEVVASDVVGYWDSEGDMPITGIPLEDAVAIDSSKSESKPSILTKWKLTIPTEVFAKEGGAFLAKEGQIVGVWYKPGMRDIRKLAGVEVFMCRDKRLDKDTGKTTIDKRTGQKKLNDKGEIEGLMKGFQIRANETGRPIVIVEDRRVKSSSAKTVFDQTPQKLPPPATPPRDAPSAAADEDIDDLPF